MNSWNFLFALVILPTILLLSACTTSDQYTEPEVCTMEYDPVCGLVDVQCIKAPCNPIPTTFSNQCMAEQAGAYDIVPGVCPEPIASFAECEAAGYPIMESYPRQCSTGDQTFTEQLAPQEACELQEGNWIANASECEGIDETTCESLGGTFNPCASACRNDPSAEMCTMQCVLVCEFN